MNDYALIKPKKMLLAIDTLFFRATKLALPEFLFSSLN